MLFGICTLVMDVFKTGYYSSFFGCQSAIKILHPLAQAVFVIIQASGCEVCPWVQRTGPNTWGGVGRPELHSFPALSNPIRWRQAGEEIKRVHTSGSTW